MKSRHAFVCGIVNLIKLRYSAFKKGKSGDGSPIDSASWPFGASIPTSVETDEWFPFLTP